MLNKSLLVIAKIYLCITLSLSFVASSHIAAQETSPRIQENPIKLAHPRMPDRAKESGYCCVLYDVDHKGKPVNITAPICSAPIFRKYSIHTVKKWRYKTNHTTTGQLLHQDYDTVITFLKQTNKTPFFPIPGGNGYMKPKVPIENIPPRPKGFKEGFNWQKTYFNSKPLCNLHELS